METEPIKLNKNNRLVHAYNNEPSFVQQYFHYHPFGDDEKRLAHIKNRAYQRHELADVLTNMNSEWQASTETLDNINRLRDPESTVVIGGQQAGLLTGPLYSVNKLISIVRLASEKEKQLNHPVIPIFWIAGEDHDFDEINHIFSIKKHKNYKHTIKQHETIKKSVSDIEIDKEAAQEWLQLFLNDLPETVYTAEWFHKTIQCLEKSTTYTDFFARLIFQLFPHNGIVLVDAHDQALRRLESDYFNLMLTHQQEITDHVYTNLQKLQQQGYPVALDMEENSANLFFHDERDDRILLERKQEDWVGKKDEVQKTTEEMRMIAHNEPWRLSTNVITRPMMQELLFPTLAFVAGDGEISYWATLKQAFEVIDIEVPPVVPRLSFTYITERADKLLQRRSLTPEEVIHEGTGRVKQRWLLAQDSVPVDTLFQEAKESIENIHAPIRNYAASISPDLHNEAEKNMQYISRQLDYLQKRTISKLQMKYNTPLNQFDELECDLRPTGVLQERVWNPYLLINQYGYDFLQEMIKTEHFSFKNNHYLVYLSNPKK